MGAIEFSFGGDERTEASMSSDGVGVSTGTTKGYTMDVERRPKDAQEAEDTNDDLEAADHEAGDGGSEDTGEDHQEETSDDGGESTDESAEPNVIEKFDPADAENVAAWEKEYVKDGSLNLEQLSKVFWKSVDDGKPGFNDATYEFLKSKGISKADVKRFEAMGLNDAAFQKDSMAKHDDELFDLAGSQDLLNEALMWAKESGAYNEQRQAAFNKTMTSTDLDAKKEAVELLMVRYQKTDAFKAAEAKRHQNAKPKQPQRDATKSQGRPNPTLKPYANVAEWRQARKEAKGDITKLREIDARRKVSNF